MNMRGPNLRQRVRDGELTEEQADEITERYWDRERDIDTDRKSEQQNKNENDRINRS